MLRIDSEMTTKVTSMIKTKSIYKAKEESDGIRILVTRFYPRGVKKDHFDYWIRDLSPSIELLKGYKSGSRSWDEFTIALLSEFRDNANSLEIIHKLHTQSNWNNITLLCYEKDGSLCHRHLLRDIISDPSLLNSHFVSEYTDNHKRCPVEKHVSHEEACVIP